jgi:hypothetical protein
MLDVPAHQRGSAVLSFRHVRNEIAQKQKAGAIAGLRLESVW